MAPPDWVIDRDERRVAPGCGWYPLRSRATLLWAAVGFVGLIDLLWGLSGGWKLMGDRALLSVALGAGSLLPLLLIDRYRSDVRIRSTVLAVLQLIAFSLVASVLSYLAVSVGTPLADNTFAVWDRYFGFDWLAVTDWVAKHRLFKLILSLAYQSGLIQIGFVVLFLGLTARIRQLDEFIDLYICGLLIAIGCSIVLPAAGPWVGVPVGTPFDASVLSHFLPLHEGRSRVIDLDHAQGLISMPSVHAMTAIFIIYVMRGTGVLFPPMFILNTLMLVSTPTEGGHYLVDVLVGGAVAFGLIFLRKRFAYQWRSR